MWILICFLNSCKWCRSPHCSGRDAVDCDSKSTYHLSCQDAKERPREWLIVNFGFINTMANWRHCWKSRATNSCIVFSIVRIIELFGSDQESTYKYIFWMTSSVTEWCVCDGRASCLRILQFFHVLLVLLNSRPTNCDSLMELGQSSTSANYSRSPEAFLKHQNSCALKYFGVFHLVLSRRKLSCELFSSLFSLTTFTTHSSSVETGT